MALAFTRPAPPGFGLFICTCRKVIGRCFARSIFSFAIQDESHRVLPGKAMENADINIDMVLGSIFINAAPVDRRGYGNSSEWSGFNDRC